MADAGKKLLGLFHDDTSKLHIIPCCHDAFSARLIQRQAFPALFVSGFAVAASHGFPDTGLFCFKEVRDSLKYIVDALPPGYPVIADADTGFGNEMNVKRTVREFASIGCAALMLEDQVAPKQCGHTEGKQVISREHALSKIRAAVDARNTFRDEHGLEVGILILARTDARATLGIEEAICRCQEFIKAGADMTFLEAPQSLQEMEMYCQQVPGIKMANMLTKGKTPGLSPNRLKEIGFTFAAYPITILLGIIEAVNKTLEELKDLDREPQCNGEVVNQLWELTGFKDYQAESSQYGCNEWKKAAASDDS